MCTTAATSPQPRDVYKATWRKKGQSPCSSLPLCFAVSSQEWQRSQNSSTQEAIMVFKHKQPRLSLLRGSLSFALNTSYDKARTMRGFLQPVYSEWQTVTRDCWLLSKACCSFQAARGFTSFKCDMEISLQSEVIHPSQHNVCFYRHEYVIAAWWWKLKSVLYLPV